MRRWQFESLNVDRHGKIGELERRCLGRWQALIGKRLANDVQTRCCEIVDFQPPAQQGEPGPDDTYILHPQPHTFAVGDRYLVYRRVGSQRSLDTAKANLPVRGRELVLDDTLDGGIAFAPLLRIALGKHRQGAKQQDYGKNDPSQNACPNPI